MTDQKYDLVNESNQVTITLDGDSGDVIMKDGSGHERVRVGRVVEYGVTGGGGKGKGGGGGGSSGPTIVADYWGFRVKNATGANVMQLGWHASGQSQVSALPAASTIRLYLGGGGNDGALTLLGGDGKTLVQVDGPSGRLVINDKAGRQRVRLDGGDGDLTLGGKGTDGDVTLLSATDQPIVSLNAGDGDTIQARDESAQKKIVFAFDKNASANTRAGLFIGAHSSQGGKKPGLVVVRDDAGDGGVTLSGAKGDDDIAVDQPGKRVFAFDKNALGDKSAGLFIGAHSSQGGKRPGFIAIRDDDGNDAVVLDGHAGDIVLANADCAERFDLADVDVESGTVMVIGDSGVLEPSAQPYDRRVAGIVSGAGRHRPGIVLDGFGAGRSKPIALVGKVFCKVDARGRPIAVGDLLTTSLTPGHAMRADDAERGFGAILGKALQAFDDGTGLIPILVALQ